MSKLVISLRHDEFYRTLSLYLVVREVRGGYGSMLSR